MRLMPRSKVAVVRVRPDRILDDIDRLHRLAGVEQALQKGAQTILKDNISWHFPFPGANTTPWQLEGTIRSLRARGHADLVCVQNKTVVTDAFKGEDLNGYVPIFKKYDIPVRYNFKPEDMTWSVYRPRAKMRVRRTCRWRAAACWWWMTTRRSGAWWPRCCVARTSRSRSRWTATRRWRAWRSRCPRWCSPT